MTSFAALRTLKIHFFGILIPWLSFLPYALDITMFFKVVGWVARGTSARSGGPIRQTSQLSISYAMGLINTNLGSQFKQNLAFISQPQRRRHTRRCYASVWHMSSKKLQKRLVLHPQNHCWSNLNNRHQRRYNMLTWDFYHEGIA